MWSKKEKTEYASKWRKNNPEKVRLANEKHYPKKKARQMLIYRMDSKVYLRNKSAIMKHRYGIVVEDYENMVKSQNGVCLICKNPPISNKNSCKLHIDHNHKTKKVRGLLCFKCNNGIGSFNDDILLLKEAIKYLEFNS